MILLDTNTLFGAKGRGASAELIKTLRAVGQTVAVPWIVMEELTAQKVLEHQKSHEAAAAAAQALREATPWEMPQLQVPGPDPERVRQHWWDVYSALLTVLEPSADVLQKSMSREANCVAPCKSVTVTGRKSSVKKIGARDAAIWLTAVDYARTHPDESVYFVSADGDFGAPGNYPPPMSEDVEGLGDRFVHRKTVGDVLQAFAESTAVDREALQAILTRQETRAVVRAEARQLWEAPRSDNQPSLGTFACRVLTEDRVGSALGWLSPPAVALHSMPHFDAYRIDDQVWCMVAARWTLVGTAFLAEPAALAGAAALWDTRVLVNLQEPESAPTILGAGRVQAASVKEADAAFPGYPLRPPLQLQVGPGTPLGEALATMAAIFGLAAKYKDNGQSDDQAE